MVCSLRGKLIATKFALESITASMPDGKILFFCSGSIKYTVGSVENLSNKGGLIFIFEISDCFTGRR